MIAREWESLNAKAELGPFASRRTLSRGNDVVSSTRGFWSLAGPRWMRFTEGRRPKDRSRIGGSLVSPGLATRRDRGLNCQKQGTTASSTPLLIIAPDAVGWAPSVWQAHWLLPSGDCGSVASCQLAMADRAQGRPDDRPGGDDSDPGLASRRDRGLNCPEEVLSNQRGLRQHTLKGRDPRTLDSVCKTSSFL